MSTARHNCLKISLVLLSFLIAVPACAQTNVTCTASAAVPPIVRASGLTELTSDILLLCTGGTPTAVGAPVPTVNLSVSFNTNLTSRWLAAQDIEHVWTESLLLIGEPLPASQLVCGAPAAPQTAPGICAITGNNGNGVYSGEPGRPNVFQAKRAGPNALVFFSVPLDPPGSSTLYLRIVNTRVNMSMLEGPLLQVTGSPSVTSAFAIEITNPTQIVGFGQAGVSFTLNSAPPIFQQSVAQNQDLAHNPRKDGVSQFSVRVSEVFPTALKQRTVAVYVDANTSPAPAAQSTPGAIFGSESGFFNPSFPAIPDRGNLGTAGLANFGTRIALRFSDVPAGVSLFTDAVVNLKAASVSSGVLRRINFDAGSFTPSAVGIVPVSVDTATGTGVAVYEVLSSSPIQSESAEIPVYVAYVSKGSKKAATGTAKVSVYLAPASAANEGSLTDPLPRFANNSEPVPAFTIAP